MPVFVRKADDFVLDRWAIAWSCALDDPAVHRRAMEVGTDDVVERLGCVDLVAGELRTPGTARRVGIGGVGSAIDPAVCVVCYDGELPVVVVEPARAGVVIVAKESWGLAPMLGFAVRKIDATGIDARRGAGFETSNPKSQGCEIICQRSRGGLAGAACGPDGRTGDGPTPQKGPAGHDHTARSIDALGVADDMEPRCVRVGLGSEWDNPFDHGLTNVEVRQCFEVFLHDAGVEAFVTLRTERLHCGSFGFVQEAHLNEGAVRDTADYSPQSVDFAHEVAFGRAADGWIAR